MISFLVMTDKDGRIKKINWSNPVYLLSNINNSILNIFRKEDEKAILQLINKNHSENISSNENEFTLKNTKQKVHLSSQIVGDNRIILGVEEVQYDEVFMSVLIKYFMEALKDNLIICNQEGSDEIRHNFEEIQLFNNELINARRELSKANIKLEIMNKEIKYLNEELSNRLVKDALTGLVSRYQYGTEMQLQIEKNPDKYGIFIFMDIDNFKAVNDNYGHNIGDLYLIAFADRLKELTIQDCIKMRISGDEFGLFIYNIELTDSYIMGNIWEKILEDVLAKPLKAGDFELPISISAGMSVFGKDTENIFELIEFADFAMYQVKKSGKNKFRIFERDLYNEQN